MRKNKKTNAQKGFEELKALYPELKKEELVVSFEYNLHPSIPGVRCKGTVIIDRKYISVFRDGKKIEKIAVADVASLKVENGVGTCSVEYRLKTDDLPRLLCRMDMSIGKRVTNITKKFNRIAEREGFENYDASAEKNRRRSHEGEKGRCPKCGRAMRRGVCMHCTNKFRTVARLWNIVKPYKVFIFLSIIFFFLVSGLNLLPQGECK